MNYNGGAEKFVDLLADIMPNSASRIQMHASIIWKAGKRKHMLNVGLLGAGRIAGVHAAAISQNPNSNLVAISDFYPEVAEKLAKQFDAIARTNDEIIADSEIKLMRFWR